jgi:hypothetical protein
MNIYHRYLDLAIDPKIDLFNRIEYDTTQYNHVKIEKEEINPDIIDWLSRFDFTVNWFEAFYTPPNGGKLPIHTDSSRISDNVKINWTYGAPGSKLIWWEPKDDKCAKIVRTVFGTEYMTADENDCIRLHEAEINQPSLVNAGRYHSTFNPTLEGRWTLSLPLLDKQSGDNVTWKDAVAKLNKIIK